MPTFSGPFAGNGVITVFQYTFDLEGAFNTLVVGIKTADEPDYTIQTIITDYAHVASTKLVTFVVAPPTGTDVILVRATSQIRGVNYIDGTTFAPKTVNRDLNRLATVDEEVTDVVPDVRTSQPLVADMPTLAVPTTLDMGVDANLLILQAKMDGTHDVVYTIAVPEGGETVRSAGTAIGDGSTFGPELSFVLNSDPSMIDISMLAENAFTAWTQIKMVAMQIPARANL